MLCSRFSRRRALSLIEVVLGLALLVTLLTGLLAAFGRSVRQSARAETRLWAASVAEDLLTDWFEDPGSVPISASGSIPDRTNYSWSTRTIQQPKLDYLDALVVRLEIIDTRDSQPQPLVTVDFLLAEVKDELRKTNAIKKNER